MSPRNNETVYPKPEPSNLPLVMQIVAMCFGAMLFLTLLFFLFFTQYVDYGSVGVKFNFMGDSRGVDEKVLSPGYHVVNPFMQRIYEYPTVTQNFVYDGREAMSFNSNDGAQLAADVGLSYCVDETKVSALFRKFRNNVDAILHGYVRILVRDTINEVASNYKATEIFGDKKQEFMVSFQSEVKTRLAEIGFIIDQCTITGEIKCDDRVRESVSKVIEASQRAMEAEQKIKQSEAEAKQKIAEAECDAQSILARAKAQAEANDLVNKSLTPELVKYKMIEKWDGKAPQVMGHTDGLMIPITKE